MNAKIITFSVFAVLFIGAALGCYSLGCETLGDMAKYFSVAFVVAFVVFVVVLRVVGACRAILKKCI